ncbi:MAG: translation initiation factor IF-2 subunit alpha [Candidatus Methanofastidiosa archaeon]|nr:translation initiation factor IF-2 subunit alpha [Candidatus Methanofastidiosa archaeon]
MFEYEEGFPEVGTFVMCTITEIFPYGAMVKLDEYDLDGMIPIREISSSWVKNIRNHVKENQKVVCKVLRVDEDKRHIDLSLRKVTQKQQKAAVRRYKVKKKGNKLLEYFGSQNGMPSDQLLDIYNKVLERYTMVYECFEEVVAKGEKVLEDLVPPQHIGSLKDIIIANIETPLVEINGELSITCPKGDGVRIIKEDLITARDENTSEDVSVDIRLLGSPRYSVKIIAPDYKMAESALDNVINQITKKINSNSGEASFKRKK